MVEDEVSIALLRQFGLVAGMGLFSIDESGRAKLRLAGGIRLRSFNDDEYLYESYGYSELEDE